MVTFKGANLITVTFQTKPHWPPGHRELAFLRTFNFHATTGAHQPGTGSSTTPRRTPPAPHSLAPAPRPSPN